MTMTWDVTSVQFSLCKRGLSKLVAFFGARPSALSFLKSHEVSSKWGVASWKCLTCLEFISILIEMTLTYLSTKFIKVLSPCFVGQASATGSLWVRPASLDRISVTRVSPKGPKGVILKSHESVELVKLGTLKMIPGGVQPWPALLALPTLGCYGVSARQLTALQMSTKLPTMKLRSNMKRSSNILYLYLHI